MRSDDEHRPDPAAACGRILDNRAGDRTIAVLEDALSEIREGAVDPAVAGCILDRLADWLAQDIDPGSSRYGQIPLRVGGTLDDLNAVLFLLPPLVALDAHARQAGGDVAQRWRRIIERASDAVERRWDHEVFDPHRDFVAYTNVFLLYIRSLLLCGRHLAIPRLVAKGEAQWLRWFHRMAYHGIDEFLSPTYTDIDLDALEAIAKLLPDTSMRQEVGRAAWLLMAASAAAFHATLGLQVAGSSRSYREFLTPGDCTPRWMKSDDPELRGIAAQVRKIADSAPYPRRFRGRAGAFGFCGWHSAQSGVGTMTGGNYFWQQIHWMAACGRDAMQRAVAWAPGSFTPTPGWTDQDDNAALCVFSRSPHSLHRTQWRTPPDKVTQTMADHGIGLAGDWQIEMRGMDAYLTAQGHLLAIRPFVMREGKPAPVCLSPVQRRERGQGRFHPGPADFMELLFPADAVQFGFYALLGQPGEVTLPDIGFTATGARRNWRAGRCAVSLTELPGGEFRDAMPVELTDPLLAWAGIAVFPGDPVTPPPI